MIVNKELFLSDVMPSIFKSSDTETLLFNSVRSLRKYMPIDMIDMSYHLEDQNRNLRICTIEKNRTFKNTFMDYYDVDQRQGLVINDGVYILKDMFEKYNITSHKVCSVEGNSCIVIQCKNGDRTVGAIAFKAYRENVYYREHVELLRNLVVPYSMALLATLANNSLVVFNPEMGKHMTRPKTMMTVKTKLSSGIVGEFGGLKNEVLKAADVAKYNSTVLITGETGVGKEVFSNYIHTSSARRREPFVKINCGAIPESLIDNELFGHEKGAFTGADTAVKGRFELANKGTLFLDEIGELPLASQAKLLRVLQFGEVERLGGNKTVSVDVRIIAATNKDLKKMVKDGSFREDLYWRLNVFPLHIKPLRERKEDIPEIVNFLIQKICKKLDVKYIPIIEDCVMERLVCYSWPGNVREMENAVEREIISNSGEKLKFSWLKPCEKEEVSAETEGGAMLDDAMKKHIMKALDRTNWRISGDKGAASILGVHPNTLRHRMKKLGII